MNRINKYTFTLIAITLALSLSAQKSDEGESIPFLYATFAVQQPGGDLATRFGNSSDIGAGVGIKTKSNWMLSLEGTYLFGKSVKENPIMSITNIDGTITDIYGEESTLVFWERGMHWRGTVGKIIPVSKRSPSSGIFIRGSLGLFQHKIWIENRNNNTPQIQGDYQKGYDKLCNGLSITEFIGWQNWSEHKGFNFFVGFEFMQAWTQNRRAWDFPSNQKISDPRLDLISSLRIGWFIPFKRRQASNHYYY